MVRAMVAREQNGSYTVTFGEVSTPMRNQRIVNMPVSETKHATVSSAVSKPISETSNGTNPLEEAKTAWKSVIDEVDRGIQAVSTYSETEPQRALEEAKKLSKKLTTSFKKIENAVKNNPAEQQMIKAENKKITDIISNVFKTANKALKLTKGGRRTHRKRTHQKHIHHKRTRRKRTHHL